MNIAQLEEHIQRAIERFGKMNNKPFRHNGWGVLVKVAKTDRANPKRWHFFVHRQLIGMDFALCVGVSQSQIHTMFLIPVDLIAKKRMLAIPNRPSHKLWDFVATKEQVIERLSTPKKEDKWHMLKTPL